MNNKSLHQEYLKTQESWVNDPFDLKDQVLEYNLESHQKKLSYYFYYKAKLGQFSPFLELKSPVFPC